MSVTCSSQQVNTYKFSLARSQYPCYPSICRVIIETLVFAVTWQNGVSLTPVRAWPHDETRSFDIALKGLPFEHSAKLHLTVFFFKLT